MKISQRYSHFNGEEYLLIHRKEEYQEIINGITRINASDHKGETSGGEGKSKKMLINSSSLRREFKRLLTKQGWKERREDSCFSSEADYIKNKISLELKLDKSSATEHNFFVKHLPFYMNQIINTGIEILPTLAMQREMSSGPPWFEKEVHNVLRHGRTNPPVPLLILGIEP